jgi:glutathione S-transferase
MSKFTLYGSSRSRAARVAWCAREIGLPFEQIEIPFEQMKGPEYLSINPNGKVPGFVEGDLKLFESLAINLYLAKKYSTGELYPTTLEDEARVLQWTLWAATELEPKVLPSLLFKLGFYKDEAQAKTLAEAAKAPLKVLDDTLKSREWLIGNRFGIADLNVACVVGTGLAGDVDMSSAPNVLKWMERINARPARNG